MQESPTPDNLEDLHIILYRSICYKRCPDYTLTLEGNGRVTFEGRYNTSVKGIVTSTIGQDKLFEIAAEIHRADFFNLEDAYFEPATDRPTYDLSVHLRGKKKQVTSYGIRPPQLEILLDRIDEIANTNQWING
jgi:hypothetical protein